MWSESQLIVTYQSACVVRFVRLEFQQAMLVYQVYISVLSPVL